MECAEPVEKKFGQWNNVLVRSNYDCYHIWEYRLIKYPLSIQDDRHEIQFIDISTSDNGDFPRIIEIALFLFKIALQVERAILKIIQTGSVSDLFFF